MRENVTDLNKIVDLVRCAYSWVLKISKKKLDLKDFDHLKYLFEQRTTLCA
jgi:hypothetical protein